MGTLERRNFPFLGRRGDLAEWFEGLPFSSETHPIRIEEAREDGAYVIRAELPGMDPDTDVEITLERGGVLTIHAERSEEKKSKEHSEFRYGSFSRSVTLPTGVREEDVSATYDKGILTVRVPLGEVESTARRIEIGRAG